MILNADARAIPLKDETVQLVITSPPYWGLRDYGTGRWEGGVPFCDHGVPKEAAKKEHIQEGGYSYPNHAAPVKFRTGKHYVNQTEHPTGSGYKKGREDYGVNEYPSIGYERLVRRAGFGSKTTCSCGATWIDPAIGLENSLNDYLREIVAVFREVHRVLRQDGLLFVNLGDTYSGSGRGEGADRTGTKQETNVGSLTLHRTPKIESIRGSQLLGMPWRVAFALQEDGWFLRSDIIWHKPNPMPEALSTKRCTTAHEYLFMFAKTNMSYYWDGKAIEEPVVPDRHSIGRGYKRTRGKSYTDIEGREHSFDDPWEENDGQTMKMTPGGRGVRGNQSWGQYTLGAGKGPEVRNKRDVWTITVEHGSELHYATFPQALVLPCILAGSRMGDIVFDPFGGTSTTGYVAERIGRRWVTTELSWEYCKAAQRRTAQMGLFR